MAPSVFFSLQVFMGFFFLLLSFFVSNKRDNTVAAAVTLFDVLQVANISTRRKW